MTGEAKGVARLWVDEIEAYENTVRYTSIGLSSAHTHVRGPAAREVVAKERVRARA